MKPGRHKEFAERVQVNLCLPTGGTKALKRAAKRAGHVHLASWMRDVLLAAAEYVQVER